MATRQERFARQVEDLLRESRAMSRETAARVVALLEDARREIAGRIAVATARGGADSFTAVQLNALLGEIDRALREFQVRAGQAVLRGIEQQHRLGVELVDRPLAQVSLLPLVGGLPTARLGIWQGYSASLVTGLGRELRSKLDAELRRAMLGGQPVIEIVGRIDKLLGGAEGRAETIAFTEINRMQSIATQERLEQMHARLGDDLEKEWRHNAIGVPRQGHVRMDRMAVKVHERFFIPEYFPAAGGGKPVAAEWARYPRDPELSAANAVNCHCTSVPKLALAERSEVPRYGRLELVA